MGRLGLILLGISASMLCSEILVRRLAPQELSGSWRVETPSGLVMNRSHGSARHVAGDRDVHYRFAMPGLRGEPLGGAQHRVLVLGDSFAFGWLLTEQDSTVGKLQQQANTRYGIDHLRFANASCGGWGLDEMVAYVEAFGERVEPSLVLVFLNTDDIGRCLRHPRYEWDPDAPSLRRLEGRPSLGRRVARGLPGYQFLLEHSHLIQLARRVAVWGIDWPPLAEEPDRKGLESPSAGWHLGPKSNPVADPQAVVRLAQALYLRLSHWGQQRGAPLVVLTTGWHTPTLGAPSGEPTEAFMETAAAFFERNGIHYHDRSPLIRPQIDETPPAFHLVENVHPNEKGAALIAHHAWQALLPHLDTLSQRDRPPSF